jgi:hypothetical protein
MLETQMVMRYGNRSGGLGVVGSNPAAPTIIYLDQENTMIAHPMRAIAIACFLVGTPPAALAAPFDGEWSFVVSTKDHCGNSRWGFGINEGTIHNRYLMFVGGFPARVSGQVSPTGQVTINLVAGPRVATATGTLGKRAGNGKWDGKGPSGTCAGIWTATRQS